MHRLKVILLCLISLSISGALQAQTVVEESGVATYDSYSGAATVGSGSYFNLRYMSGSGVGYHNGYGQLGGMIPFWLGENGMIAPDTRLLLSNHGNIGANLGLVARYYSPSYDRIFGSAMYLDIDQSENDNTYTQGVFGLETLGEFWDLRANAYYVPGNQDHLVSTGAPLCVGGDPFFSGNNIVFMGQQAALREQGMSGFDVEFGMPLWRSLPWLRAYAGAYYYEADQVQPPPVDVVIPNTTEDKPVGFRGRLAAWVADDLMLGVNVTTDPVWGTNVNGVVDFRFSGFKPTRYFPNFSTRERMLAPWERNWRIAVQQYGTANTALVTAINPDTGNPYFVSFIDNSNPNPGNGTFENPFNSFDHPGGIPNADIILVGRGTSTAANPYLGTMRLFDDQLLLGQGSSLDPITLSAVFGNCSVNGDFTLPGLDGSGNYPFVSNPAGPIVTLANNNQVSGFNMLNGGGDAIVGNNINNFNLHNLEIRGNAGVGINLTNATGTTTIIRDINIGSTNFPNPNGVGNNAGGGIVVTAGAAGISNLQLTNVFMNSTPAGTSPFGISLGAVNGNLTTNMNNVHTNGNQTGIVLTETNQSLTANITNSTSNNNTVDGLVLTASGGTSLLNLTNVQLNGNGRDGLGLYGSNGTTINDNIIDSQLNNNGRDGIHKELSGGSTNNEFIDPTLITGNGRDGVFFSLVGGSVMNEAILNNNFSGNGRSGVFGTMDASTATLNITSTLMTGSGADGIALSATNGSVFNSTLTNVHVSNSGANGILAGFTGLSTGNINMLGVMSNGSVGNGMALGANSSLLNVTAVTSAFDGNQANGITSQITNGSLFNLTTAGGSTINGNAASGVAISATNSNVNAVFADTAVNNNSTGDGIRALLSGASDSSIVLTGSTSLINNGGSGLLLGTSASTVDLTMTGTTVTGNTQNGVTVQGGNTSNITGTLTNLLVSGNDVNGFNVQSVTGSAVDLSLTGVNASANQGTNAALLAAGGFLNFEATTSNFSGSTTGNGINATVSGVNSTLYLDLDSSLVNGNAGAGINALAASGAPGVGQTGASLNVCLDNSSVSNNTLQGVSVVSAGAGATASFGIGNTMPGSASILNANGLEGFKGNALSGGTINLRSVGSHFDGNGTAAASDGVNLSGNAGIIRTLFHGGSADGNSRNGVRLGPVEPNASSNGSDLTLSVGNGFSASNNAQYGLVLNGNGANSANMIQDPNTPPVVLNGNGAGAQDLDFSGANQVLLQLLGNFDNSGGDGIHLEFNNITTAIVSINGLGNGTINNNAGNGIYVEFNNVQNTAVTVSGYSSISNNGLNGVYIEMNGAAPNNRSRGAIEIQGVAGNTLMSGNGENGVNINLTNTDLVDPFNSLPGVNLNVLTLTDNDPLNACIPVSVVLPGGGGGLTPTSALRIDNLTVQNTGAAGGTGGITVAGTNSNIVPGNGFITDNVVTNSQNGPGISVSLNETVAATTPIASGFTISGNTVTGSQGNGIEFHIINSAITNVPTADNLTIANNVATINNGNGISVILDSPTGSSTTANNMTISGNIAQQNAGNGLLVDLDSTDVDGLTMVGNGFNENDLTGFDLLLDDSNIQNVTASNWTIADNNLNGWRVLLENASSFTGASLTNTSIRGNGLDGLTVDATDGSTSNFTAAFTGADIIDNGQTIGNGVRLRLYGGSGGVLSFDSSRIGNTDPAATQQYGIDFILGTPALDGGTLQLSLTDSNVSGNDVDGILGLVNGTGTAAESLANIALLRTTMSANNATAIDLEVNNAGLLGVTVDESTIDTNGSDGIHVNALDPNTVALIQVINNSFLTNNGQTTPPGLGNGMTVNADADATGTIVIADSTIGNSAIGGAQQNGVVLNVNRTIVGSLTNLNVSITDSTLSNNVVSGILADITGNNVGPNPTNGLTIDIINSTIASNGLTGVGGSGASFIVDQGALLDLTILESSISSNGHHGVFIAAMDAFTLAQVDLHDSALNGNGTLLFPGDGFNATVDGAATMNVGAETTIGSATPMSFSGNTGDGFDVQASGVGTRVDIDFHSVIAGADLVNGLTGNTLAGTRVDVFDGGELNLRANTTRFDGNLGDGLQGSANNASGDNTVARFRIIGGTADGNGGDGFDLLATNTTVGPVGVTTLTAQFQADDFGTGISAQNNGGYGLSFVASNLVPPGGGIVGNLLMTGGSTLLNNGAGTLNVDMNGADQAIIGLSGTFNGSPTGDGIAINLQNITGLALVSLQGPGEVRNNAGDGIDVRMTNVAQGGVFIGGFSDVSDNGLLNDATIGQDGIRVEMNNVTLGAVTIDAQTATLPANIMNVSNNTGNGVNVIVNNGSVIDNTAFNALLGANLVDVIEYIPPDAPLPDPLPNPLLNIVPVNVSTALGIAFTPTLAIQNLNVDNNGNATGGNLSGDGIVLTANTGAQIVGIPSINLNTITNTGSTSATTTHDGIAVHVLGGADVTSVDIVFNNIQSNNGNGILALANLAPTLTSLNISDNVVSNNVGGLGTSGNGIVLQLTDAAVLDTVTIDANDVQSNSGDGFQMLFPNTGVDLTVNFLHNSFIDNGSIVPPSASTTFPAGGMGINVVLNNLNAIRNTINILSDAQGVNTISQSASFGLFLQASNTALYSLNVTGTGAQNVFDSNVDAGIAVVGGSFVNPNNSLDPTRFSVGDVLIDNVLVTNTAAGSHPALPNYPFAGDGIGVLLQQYAQMNSFVIGSAAARNTEVSTNAGDGVRINAIEQSQFRHTQADGVTAITPLGQATVLMQQVDALNNGRNGINIIRRDNAVLSWDDETVNAGAALFQLGNELSWQTITDAGSFVHLNDIIATGNGTSNVAGANNGLAVSTTNAQFPVTRIDIIDTNPVALTYNPKTVGNSVFDENAGRGMQFVASADQILLVNASDTSASDNNQGGILVQTFNRATFGNVLTSTPLGDPTSDNSIRSTFNGMLISGNGSGNAPGGANANAHGFEVQANGGGDPFNASSQSVVNISMTQSATNARNLFDSNGGDAYRITANRGSDNYFNLNRIDMRDTAFVQLGNDGLHVTTNDFSSTRVDLTNASIGYPTASSTQTGLSGDGIDIRTNSTSFMALNVGNTLALNRFGDGIAQGAADPINAPDVSIFGNQLNGIVVRNTSTSAFIGNVFDTSSRFNGNRGYSAEMQDNSTNFHAIDTSLFSDNSAEGVAILLNSRSQSGLFNDVASIATTNPAFQNAYNAYNFLNLGDPGFLEAGFVLTNSRVENNGSTSPYVPVGQNVNGLQIAVSTRAYLAADIRNNIFSGNTLDDVGTASFVATSGGFNANGTINTTGQLNTPGSIDEVSAGVDRIFLEDTALLDMRFMHNRGDQLAISSSGSNNPNLGATGARVTDPNTKAPQRTVNASTALFQVNAFHYDIASNVVSDNVFSGSNILPFDAAAPNLVQDPANYPGPNTLPGPPAARFLETGLVDQDDFYYNPFADPNNNPPVAFTQVRIDNITQNVPGILGTNGNGVIDYNGATGTFTLDGAGSPGIANGDVFRVHLLDTNSFNQFGVAQNVEQAFINGFQNFTVRIPTGQTAPASGTFFQTNRLAPYFQWPSATFPPF